MSNRASVSTPSRGTFLSPEMGLHVLACLFCSIIYGLLLLQFCLLFGRYYGGNAVQGADLDDHQATFFSVADKVDESLQGLEPLCW